MATSMEHLFYHFLTPAEPTQLIPTILSLGLGVAVSASPTHPSFVLFSFYISLARSLSLRTCFVELHFHTTVLLVLFSVSQYATPYQMACV